MIKLLPYLWYDVGHLGLSSAKRFRRWLTYISEHTLNTWWFLFSRCHVRKNVTCDNLDLSVFGFFLGCKISTNISYYFKYECITKRWHSKRACSEVDSCTRTLEASALFLTCFFASSTCLLSFSAAVTMYSLEIWKMQTQRKFNKLCTVMCEKTKKCN